MFSKALIVVSVLLSVAAVSAISESKAEAGTSACNACMDHRCAWSGYKCGHTDGCLDYMACMGRCVGGDDHRALQCNLACSEGKDREAVEAAVKLFTCAADNCKKECN